MKIWGAHVVIASRSLEKLEDAAKNVSGSRELFALNMLDESAITKLISWMSRIDHLVLTAVADENKYRGRLTDLTVDEMEGSFDKFRRFFLVTRATVRQMPDDGSITLISGASALKPPREGMSVLAAVNAAVITFGQALALELSPIRVNVVAPGVVDTAVWSGEQRERIKGGRNRRTFPPDDSGNRRTLQKQWSS